MTLLLRHDDVLDVLHGQVLTEGVIEQPLQLVHRQLLHVTLGGGHGALAAATTATTTNRPTQPLQPHKPVTSLSVPEGWEPLTPLLESSTNSGLPRGALGPADRNLEASLPPLCSTGPTLQWPQYSPPVSQGVPSRRQCQSQCRGTSLGSPRWKAWVPGGSQTPQSPLGRHLEQAEFQSAGRLHLGTAGQCGTQEVPSSEPHMPGSGLTLKPPNVRRPHLTGVCVGGGAAGGP